MVVILGVISQKELLQIEAKKKKRKKTKVHSKPKWLGFGKYLRELGE